MQAPLASQTSVVHALPSSHDDGVQAAVVAVKPSWKVIRVPDPPTSTSRAMNAPVADIPFPSARVPFGASTRAVI